ncbi:MAG: CPBP family intramembrane metalloprotease [Anaerolineae bacterium]|nr:CPBP family intramembrane metalloprotease [Anaerolineae bacterium]
MSSIIRRRPLLVYFVLAFVLTWGGTLLHQLAGPQRDSVLPSLFAVPGILMWYYGPALAAVIVVWSSEGKDGLRRLLRKFLVWRVGWRWYAFIVLYPLVLHLVVSGIGWLTSGPALRFFETEGIPGGNRWMVALILILYHTLVRGIGEETGWRGFALPRMQSRWGVLRGGLLLGVLWGAWHFNPANFSLLLSPLGVVIFLNIVAASVIYAWVYNHTQGSLLIAALFHMTNNIAEWVVPVGLMTGTVANLAIQTIVLWMIVAGLVLKFGPELRPQPEPTF